jgi:uncharacterized glyoxalase superfamily protein PhnB
VNEQTVKSTTVPIIRYRDAEKAIDWLCRAFGFEVFLKVEGDDRIEHARLTLEGNMVMLASLGRSGEFEDQFKAPAAIGGVTQAVMIRVPEPRIVYSSARAADAKILDDLDNATSGGQMFSCTDLESHVWVFSSSDLWMKTW